jgi:hypothetical protein
MEEDGYLAHYGILRRSGRYPWGSGTTNPSSRDFLAQVQELKKKGLSEVEIAQGFGLTTTELRSYKTIAKTEKKQADIAFAQRLRDKGTGYVEIGRRMGIPESSVRSLLAPGRKDTADILKTTTELLKEKVGDSNLIDVGSGNEAHLGISETKLKAALSVLQDQGYVVHKIESMQQGTGMMTKYKVLCPPGTPYGEVWRRKNEIQLINEHSEDGGRSYLGIQPPLQIDSKRVAVKYGKEGGAAADGLINVRPGVEDISLGKARYAHVRIGVDGTHYLKGMAVYKDDLPDGVDLMFNTNKDPTGNKLDAMKKVSDDPDNPFGATVRQITKPDIHGKPKVTSAMNIVNEEGDWDTWSHSLSSQMLSKQTPSLAKTQLDLTYERAKQELDSINALTNPTVKSKLLESHASSIDSAAVHLKAAALPRQSSHVIIPINSLKDTEIYAPNYRDGERVVLIRYPHGGKFEIPELTVNNKNREGTKLLGRAKDAVGINSKVASRLSGADFDGDTVMVIPNNDRRVKTSPALMGLKDFDPQRAYPYYEGMKVISGPYKQKQMGVVSNLITDMTIQGASQNELARAVRHSMVIIDSEKHRLNWKQSEIDNGIRDLQHKYQGKATGGASTLISRAGSKQPIPERELRKARDGGPIDKETGKLVYVNTGRHYVDEKGNVVYNTTRQKRLAVTDDARTLSSGSAIEEVYANHSNRMKALANQARKELVNTPRLKYNPDARRAYHAEVESLNAKLNLAIRNRPLERRAQLIADSTVKAKMAADPNMESDRLKKIRYQALTEARRRTGADKYIIDFTDSEWAAIQAGAISENKLRAILTNANLDRVRQLATPRQTNLMTTTAVQRAKAMANSGYTQAEIADALGVSLTTLKTTLNEE